MQERVYTQDKDEQVIIAHPHEKVLTAVHAVHGLTLLNDVLNSEAGKAVLTLLQKLAAPQPDPVAVATAYSTAFQKLAIEVHEEAFPQISDAWQAYLVTHLIDDSNLWSTQIERMGDTKLSPVLRAQAQRDLRTLQRLFQLNARLLWELTCAVVTPVMPILRDAWAPWYDLSPAYEHDMSDAREVLAHTIAESNDWADLITPLEKHWSRHGTGALARYRVLRWEGESKRLVGITYPDKIRLTNLVGQERQQSRLVTNIERFVAGLPAHDMLLYGPPGTGKSSTIKAVANAYANHGINLLEVRREDISDLPQIVASLRGRAPRYLIFIDDLSFEEHETAYKVLKVLLEGTAEARPKNILICATSNRINLVKESFADRGKPTEDVNWRDTMDEKQSLVHRFGLRVTFISPDQEQYLHIVSELVTQRNISLPEESLRSRALQWERQHASRSGRTARQFVDELEAELKLVRTTQSVKM